MTAITLPELNVRTPLNSSAAVQVARRFALIPDEQLTRTWAPCELRLTPGRIVAIVGPSGSGKSSRLQQIRTTLDQPPGIHVIGLPDIPESGEPVVDALATDLDDALAALTRVGLAEAPLLARPIGRCSAGEQWRVRLALAQRAAERIESYTLESHVVLCIDEFTSCLDRGNAMGLALHLNEWCEARNVACVVATPFEDVLDPLEPVQVIRMDGLR
ncbi:MAG: hypothetical protein AAF432_06425 [Planctomycetota bacterium]